VLPFGLRSAPAIFNAVAEVLAFVIKSRGVVWLIHYLDDSVVVGLPKSSECEEVLRVALKTFDDLSVLVVGEKTVGPVTRLKFLGLRWILET